MLRDVERRSRTISALLIAAALTACSIQEPARAAPDPVLLARGRAVEPWDAAAVDANIPPPLTDADAIDAGGPAPVEAGTQIPKPTRVVFRVTTRTQAGRYQPKNVGAIWIEDASGRGVKILALWASLRVRYLSEYLASNPVRDTADAVTSATLREHQTHEVSWNLRGSDGQEVPDGTYSVLVEVTDRDAVGKVMSVMFQKGAQPAKINPADTEYFAEVELRYE